MTVAIFPGSFDPVTNGHIEILRSGAEIFDKVIIAVSYNINKQGFLPLETRVELIKKSVAGIKNVEVDYYTGLTVEYAKRKGANVLLRGLRTVSDFEYETQIAQTNMALNSKIKTVFLSAEPKLSYISSSAVKEILLNNGDISNFVPLPVFEYFNSKRDI